MRCMVIVKATEDSENGVLPSEQDLDQMGSFNEELAKAGVMLDGGGLRHSAEGVRIHYSEDGARTTDGPFAETKELIAGYWIWEVKSMEEAIEWASRVPFNHGESIEIRPFQELRDLGESYTPELQEREASVEAEIREHHGS